MLTVTLVDTGILDLIFVLVVAAPAIGFAFGMILTRARVGKVGIRLGTQLRKREPIILHVGMDKVAKLFGGKRTPDGNYKVGQYLEIFPDSRATLPFYGSTLTISHTAVASTLNPEFLSIVKNIADSRSYKGLPGPRIADILDGLMKREKDLNDRLQLLKDIEEGRTSITEHIDRRHLRQEEADALRADLQGLVDSKGAKERKELDKLKEAKKISVERRNWDLLPHEEEIVKQVPNGKGKLEEHKELIKTWQLVSTEVLDVDEFKNYLPNSASLPDVWTAIKRSEAAAIKENEFAPNQAFKWLTFGIVVFLIFLGIGYATRLI